MMADELGSSVRNLLKYVEIYANGKPQLFDEDVFKLIVPIPDFTYGSNELVYEPVNEPVKLKESLKRVIDIISENPGINVDEIVKIIGKSKSTVKRYIVELKEIGALEREGSDKSGRWVVNKF
jgi:predicted HTH transcriptional regulator